jgi:hypothetical protein
MVFGESFESISKKEALSEVISELQSQEKTILDSIDEETKEQATNENTEAISLEYINNKEKSDVQKRQEIKEFHISLKNIVEKWDKTITKSPYKLQTNFGFWDWGSRWDISLVKNNKEILSYHYSFEEGRKPREVWVTIKVDWKIISYNSNYTEFWSTSKPIYSNYESLSKAKEYQKIIQELISWKSKKRSAK